MKKKIIIIVIFLFWYNAFTQVPTKNEIKTVALNFYNYLTNQEFTNNDIIKIKDNFFKNTLTYSIIVFKDNNWIMVSANKKADPILAYSKEHNYSDFIPPNVKGWLSQYDYYIYDITEKNYNSTDSVDYSFLWQEIINNKLDKYNSEKATIKVAPLLSTKWGQYVSNTGNDVDAYNYYTPFAGICHTLAGCPAVAIGQVMRYWQYPNCEIFNWAKMPNTLDVSNSNYLEQKKEISNLFRNIGDEISNYIYGCDESGASSEDILSALKSKFGFFSATLIQRNNYNRKQWKNKLCDELNNNRPILYFGSQMSASGIFLGGHNFVCDGWEKPLFGKRFHFNMGWNGASDGFYKFDEIPENYEFYIEAITNIYPTANCNSSIEIKQFYKYLPIHNMFYDNPVFGTITTNDVFVENGDIVHYKAYNEIILENFETEEGAEFTAEIIPCPINCNFTNYKDLPDKDYYYKLDNQISDNKQQDNKIIIYPNPNNGIFTLYSNSDIQNGRIQIYNCLGKIIFDKNFNKTNLIIDLSKNKNGVYIIKFTSNKFNSQQKIIKQ